MMGTEVYLSFDENALNRNYHTLITARFSYKKLNLCLCEIVSTGLEVRYLFRPVTDNFSVNDCYDIFYGFNEGPEAFGYYIKELILIRKGELGDKIIAFEFYLSRNSDLSSPLVVKGERKYPYSVYEDSLSEIDNTMIRWGLEFKHPHDFSAVNDIANILKLALCFFAKHPSANEFSFIASQDVLKLVKQPSVSDFINFFEKTVWDVYEEGISVLGKDNHFFTWAECTFPETRNPLEDYMIALLIRMSSHESRKVSSLKYPHEKKRSFGLDSRNEWAPSFPKRKISSDDKKVQEEYKIAVAMQYDMYEHFVYLCDNWEYYKHKFD